MEDGGTAEEASEGSRGCWGLTQGLIGLENAKETETIHYYVLILGLFNQRTPEYSHVGYLKSRTTVTDFVEGHAMTSCFMVALV